MRESDFQRKVVRELEEIFPGCIVVKNDPSYKQGFPDLTIFYEDRWAALEVKVSRGASHQPNQDRYVERLNEMSYAAFICPENKEEVFHELEGALRPEGREPARLPEPKQVRLGEQRSG